MFYFNVCIVLKSELLNPRACTMDGKGVIFDNWAVPFDRDLPGGQAF